MNWFNMALHQGWGTILFSGKLYLDPGSGSLLIQMLLAAILGIGVAVKIYWTKIRSLFSGNRAEVAQAPEDDEED